MKPKTEKKCNCAFCNGYTEHPWQPKPDSLYQQELAAAANAKFDDPKSPEAWEERFDKKWERIEKTRTGHISGRSIWNTDPDDEDGYLFIDETLKKFIRQEIAQARQQAVTEFRDKVLGVVEERYWNVDDYPVSQRDVVSDHNQALDDLAVKIKDLKL